MNNFKTAVLLAAISGLLISVGGLTMGSGGVILFSGIALAMNFSSYWFSSNLMLRISRAREVGHEEDPKLFAIIEHVSDLAGMPMPRVYIIDSPQPNAFATGRSPSHSSVAITSGIRSLLTDRELRGVIGHELAHVRNRDILTSSIVATIASAISMIGWFGMWFGGDRRMGLVALVVAPLAAAIIQMAVGRAREYQADLDGAQFVRDPEALASALTKLDQMSQQSPPMQVTQSTAHLYIVNPLNGTTLRRLFSTHPPVDDRVRRLRDMQNGHFDR